MVRVKDDDNGGTIVELPRIKPAIVKITISAGVILTLALNLFSWIWAASAKSQDLESLKRVVDPMPVQVHANTTCIQENRRMMKALLKQLALLCEKQGVEILYEAEDFFNEASER